MLCAAQGWSKVAVKKWGLEVERESCKAPWPKQVCSQEFIWSKTQRWKKRGSTVKLKPEEK